MCVSLTTLNSFSSTTEQQYHKRLRKPTPESQSRRHRSYITEPSELRMQKDMADQEQHHQQVSSGADHGHQACGDGDIKVIDSTSQEQSNNNKTTKLSISTNLASPDQPSQLATNPPDEHDFVVVGQEPAPISPIDREPPIEQFQSLSTTISPTRSINLPLPASSNIPGPKIANITSDTTTAADTKLPAAASSDDITAPTRTSTLATATETPIDTPFSPPSHTSTDLTTPEPSSTTISRKSTISPPTNSTHSSSSSTTTTTSDTLSPLSTTTTEATMFRAPTPLAELPAEPVSDRYTVTGDPAFQGGMPPVTDVTDGLLSTPDDFKDLEHFSGSRSIQAQQLQEKAKMREQKGLDPAVMYDIPATPSAQAYQIASQSIDKGYFEPEFPGEKKDA